MTQPPAPRDSGQSPAPTWHPGRTHPPYDPELAARLESGAFDGHPLRPQDIPGLRASAAGNTPSHEDVVRGRAVWCEERTVPGLPGRPDVPVLMLWPTTPGDGPRPTLLACHGGGLVAGGAQDGAAGLAGWVAELGLVVVSVDYRLAPEHPYPAALDDVIAVLAWLHRDAAPLQIDTARLGVYGISAGGCLAAAATLRCRDEGRPGPTFQMLHDPMLDDRHHRPATYEHPDSGAWDRLSSQTAWSAYLAGSAGTPGISPYAAPGRASDDPAGLLGLAPAYLDIGSADLFRDDALAYGMALAQAGVGVEMHLWPGGWHGFSDMAPDTALARLANRTRTQALARFIGVDHH